MELIVITGLVAFATGLGFLHKALNGRVRHVIKTQTLPSDVVLGSDATLLQFSTEVCSPCRATHTVLHGLANGREGLNHVDLDITHRADLAAQFNILQTPTTLILDASGTIRARIGGAVKRSTILAELDRILIAA
jgi:thioredoxin-like negative regulator of GroEL